MSSPNGMWDVMGAATGASSPQPGDPARSTQAGPARPSAWADPPTAQRSPEQPWQPTADYSPTPTGPGHGAYAANPVPSAPSAPSAASAGDAELAGALTPGEPGTLADGSPSPLIRTTKGDLRYLLGGKAMKMAAVAVLVMVLVAVGLPRVLGGAGSEAAVPPLTTPVPTQAPVLTMPGAEVDPNEGSPAADDVTEYTDEPATEPAPVATSAPEPEVVVPGGDDEQLAPEDIDEGEPLQGVAPPEDAQPEQPAADQPAPQEPGEQQGAEPTRDRPTVQVTITCSTDANVELLATGRGQVALTVDGAATTPAAGQVTHSVTVVAGGSVHAEASANDAARIRWRAQGTCS